MSAQLQDDLFPEQHYPPGFHAWLRENWHIWEEFERRAMQMWRSGRKRYSARTIIEVVRWNTDLRESDKRATWKINNTWIPAMARYFMEKHPSCKGFFEQRNATNQR